MTSKIYGLSAHTIVSDELGIRDCRWAPESNGDLFPDAQLEPELEPDERYTPAGYFLPLHRRYCFTLDVCATAESAKLPRYFTAQQDALVQSWAGERCFCNPPYSDIEPWLRKAWGSAAELVLMVLPNNRQEQPWWQTQVEQYRDRPHLERHGLFLRTFYPPGRWKFGFPGNPEGVGVGSPNFGVVLLLWERAS